MSNYEIIAGLLTGSGIKTLIFWFVDIVVMGIKGYGVHPFNSVPRTLR